MCSRYTPHDTFVCNSLAFAQQTLTGEETTDEGTHYETTESFTGLFSHFIPIEAVNKGFHDQTSALKATCEKMQPSEDLKFGEGDKDKQKD